MGFRYRRSYKVFPGIRVNVGKKSNSVTFTGNFFRTTVNRKKGTITRSVSTPIKGLSYVETQKIGKSSKRTQQTPEECSPEMYRFHSKATLALCVFAAVLAVICFACSFVEREFVGWGIGMTALALISAFCFNSWKEKRNALPEQEKEEDGETGFQNTKARQPAIQQAAKAFDMSAGSYHPNPEWVLKPPFPQNREEASVLAPQLLKQAQETGKILNQTTNPEVFFQRYDFLIGRYSCLADCMIYVKFNGTPPDQVLRELCSQEKRDAAVLFMIQRCYEKAQQKIGTLKTEKGKLNAAARFESDILSFSEYMSPETVADVQKRRGDLETKIQQGEI